MNPLLNPVEKQSVTKVTAYFWGPVLFAFGSLITLGWLDNARGPIYALILEDLSLSHLQGSMFFALASLVAVLANFLVPIMLSRMSSVRTLLVGVLFMLGFIVGLAFSSDFLRLMLAASFFGMALGIVMVTINIVIEDFVPQARQRSILSLMHSLYGLAAFLAPVILGYILNWPLPWYHSFLPVLWFAIPLLLYGLWQDLALGKKSKANGEGLIRPISLSLEDRSRKRLIIFWSLILACYVSSELYFSTRMVVLFQEGLSFNFDQARRVLSYFFLGLFVGRVLNGFLPAKISGKFILRVSLVVSVLWLGLCILFKPEWVWWIGLLMSPCFPVALSEMSAQSTTEFKRISALCIAWSSFGVVWMHMLAGAVADRWGLEASMKLPLLFLLMAMVLSFGFWPKLQRRL